MGSLLAKVLFEVVVCQLEGLFGRVRPEVPVHAAVHGLPVLVRSCGQRKCRVEYQIMRIICLDSFAKNRLLSISESQNRINLAALII